MTKTIAIKSCNHCPHFVYFPGGYFEGDCSNKDARENTQDTRITDRDSIPGWCPL